MNAILSDPINANLNNLVLIYPIDGRIDDAFLNPLLEVHLPHNVSFINVSHFTMIYGKKYIRVLKHPIPHPHGLVIHVPLIDVHLGGGGQSQNINIFDYNTFYPK